jgi:UDP-N-acetylmuramoylalanine--D-glutamate ligase
LDYQCDAGSIWAGNTKTALMSEVIASSDVIAVVGLGKTGLSVANFLFKNQQRFMMLDTRQAPPNKETFNALFPAVACEFGPLKSETLCAVSKIVLSPGVSIKEPAIQTAIAQEVPVISDIALFLENVEAPIVAITGSNGKTTVTTLVGEMLAQAGKHVAVAGNIGTPVLDLLHDGKHYDCFVLELSSFQLETTPHLGAEVAVVLNLSEDHMDRYADLQEYHRAKQRIYLGAKKVIFNRQDPLTQAPLGQGVTAFSFGLNKPDLNQFGLIEENGESYLALGLKQLINCRALKIRGSHNVANALAALAIGRAMSLPMESMLQTLQSFGGLPHRCQLIRELDGVEYFNDSKGTNVGATLAAINGLASDVQKIVLIAGGEGKGADFSPLASAFSQSLRGLVAIGKDAEKLIGVANSASIKVVAAASLIEAVAKARGIAEAGDIVLLSPACASFDMFKNYEDRGEQFIRAVEALAP